MDPGTCLTCQSIQGLNPLSPIPRIWEGRHWLVEHVHPSSIRGWLVLVAKRHVSALHQLTKDEWDEYGPILARTCRALHQELDTQKEYVVQFAEKPGFDHVHFHLVARLPDWPAEFVGPGFIANGTSTAPISVGEMAELGQALSRSIEAQGNR